MKKVLIFLFSLLGTVSFLYAQTGLNASVSLPRPGEKLLLKQIVFCPPGSVGEHAVWDFSDHSLLPYREAIVYSGKIDSVLTVSRNKTSYKYRLSGDTLFYLGYENYTTQIHHLPAVANFRYPFSYGDSLSSWFLGEGSYSHTLSLQTYGHTHTLADAYGTLLLPGSDTLRNVLRIHRRELIGQQLQPRKDAEVTASLRDIHTANERLNEDSVTWQVDTYQWYAPGYRYPVLESIETSHFRNGHTSRHFSRSLYFPPEEQVYLDNDDANRLIRESLLQNNSTVNTRSLNGNLDSQGANAFSQEVPLTNSTGSTHGTQVLSYQLDRNAQVEVLLATLSGMTVYYEPVHPAKSGIYFVHVDISQYSDHEFIFSVTVDGVRNSLKIFK